MEVETGGPAFPHIDSAMGRFEAGMTLRDYFAAKAMQGIIAASGDKNGTVDFDDEAVAKNAYAMANDMLKARKGGV